MEEFWLRYMNKKLSTTPYNEQGQSHGHWIVYDTKNEFWYECYYANGVEHGYELWANGETFYHAI